MDVQVTSKQRRSLAPPVAGAENPTAQQQQSGAYNGGGGAEPAAPLPPLESFREIELKRAQRLMVGAFPGMADDFENEKLLGSLLEQGITTFVCLQREYDPRAPEAKWRSGVAIRPYYEDAVALAGAFYPGRRLQFLHFGIEDCSVVEDDAVTDFAVALARRIKTTNEVDAASAMMRCQFVHDLRRVPIVVGSPQTQTQRDQGAHPKKADEVMAPARVAARGADDGARSAAEVPASCRASRRASSRASRCAPRSSAAASQPAGGRKIVSQPLKQHQAAQAAAGRPIVPQPPSRPPPSNPGGASS
ncbi:hypothetical protein JL720_15873 [Aureococcus anophagefferens]|nr:hypothetical protein JL720_15873 [Aureococcus anophagefferens]